MNKKNRFRTPAQDTVEGKWKQMHGQAREWRGKLTGDGLDKAAGGGSAKDKPEQSWELKHSKRRGKND